MATLIDRRVTSKQHHGSRSGHCSTGSEMQVSARTTRISTKTTSWFTVIRVQCPNVPQHVPQICHRTHTHTTNTKQETPHLPGAGSNPRHRPLNLFSFSFFSKHILVSLPGRKDTRVQTKGTRDRRPHDDPRGQHTFNDDHHDIRRGHPGTMLARHPGAGAGDTRRRGTDSRPMSLVHTTNTTSHEDPRGTSGATIDTHRPDDRRAHPGRTLARYHGAGAGATYRH